MRPALLTADAIEAKLGDLPGWTYTGNCLCREFKFENFVRAFAFMTACALEAEKLNHHPDWSNSYNKVSVSLTTHDSGGVTESDFTLARKMERWAIA